MSVQTVIRLPEDLHERLVALSQKTGLTTEFYVREALQCHVADLEDAHQSLEDAFQAADIALRIERGKAPVLGSAEFSSLAPASARLSPRWPVAD